MKINKTNKQGARCRRSHRVAAGGTFVSENEKRKINDPSTTHKASRGHFKKATKRWEPIFNERLPQDMKQWLPDD